jgi:Uma2 family endonuclease
MPGLAPYLTQAPLLSTYPAANGAFELNVPNEERWAVREVVDASPSPIRIQEPLTVAQYHELIRAGILTEDDPVELLGGRLITKMPKNPPHRLATGLVRQALEQLKLDGWYVDSQEPITLPDGEPEPDVMVVRGNRRDYKESHPGPANLALVVEVSDTTLLRDQNEKKHSYAEAGIPVYWILNLHDKQLEVHSNPTGTKAKAHYDTSVTYSEGQTVPVVILGVEKAKLAVQELLP